MKIKKEPQRNNENDVVFSSLRCSVVVQFLFFRVDESFAIVLKGFADLYGFSDLSGSPCPKVVVRPSQRSIFWLLQRHGGKAM